MKLPSNCLCGCRLTIRTESIVIKTLQNQRQSHFTNEGQSVSFSWGRAPLEAYDQIIVLEWTVTGLPLLGVLSGKKMGLSLVNCHSQLHYILRSSLSKVYVTNFASIHTYMTLFTVYTRPLSVQALNSRLCLILSSSR
jgi:hypothetical protein